MRLTRQEDRSLYLYLRDKIISPDYGEIAEEMVLTQSSSSKWDMEYMGDVCPFKRGDHSGKGRGLLFFDIVDGNTVVGPEQSQMVTVYDGPTELVRGVDYQVNYLTGQIYSTLNLASFMVDYVWAYVSVIDEFPYDDVPPLPIVSLELQGGTDQPRELGEAFGIRDASWHIEIFANNKGERDDLMDVIYAGLKGHRCVLYTFDTGLPLTREGVFNQSFILEKNNNYPHLVFENVEKTLSGLPSWGFYETETINKYRAAISFDTKAYKK